MILFVAAACASEKPKSVQPKNDVLPRQGEGATPGGSTGGESGGTNKMSGGEEEEMPTDVAPGDNCVKDCVAARQMQATSPEQIEADCQARCSEGESVTLPE